MIKTQTLKGFRDFLPTDAIKRQYVIGKIKSVFERFGFDPLETPALEYAETLLGKYGSEADKLLYLFTDLGGRKVGMRYDQTVPASRVVAQYGQDLPMPWKRYQIQPVWRAENTQKGRYREFLQCDIDIFGEASYVADAEIIAATYAVMVELGFRAFKILLNDRTLFGDIPAGALQSIDKLGKIGEEGVKAELAKKKLDPGIVDTIRNNKPSVMLREILNLLPTLGVPTSAIQFDPTLARGLDYYTSTIIEVAVEGYTAGSVGGGGRYDNLIGQFTGRAVSAVGLAFGFDRILEAMDEANLLTTAKTATQVFVAVFSPQLFNQSLLLVSHLRDSGIAAEASLAPSAKLDKQLKYADKKGIPYVAILGPDEVKKNVVQLKDMATQKQEELTPDALVAKLRAS
jgi:histidyl-tRNA synthetase